MTRGFRNGVLTIAAAAALALAACSGNSPSGVSSPQAAPSTATTTTQAPADCNLTLFTVRDGAVVEGVGAGSPAVTMRTQVTTLEDNTIVTMQPINPTDWFGWWYNMNDEGWARTGASSTGMIFPTRGTSVQFLVLFDDPTVSKCNGLPADFDPEQLKVKVQWPV